MNAHDASEQARRAFGTVGVTELIEKRLIVIIFNYVGIIMTIIAFTVAFGIGGLFGTDAEGPLMVIAGPLLGAMDISYRLNTKDGHIYIPNRGGSLFFLPVWAFGAFWFVLGFVDTIKGAS